MSSHVDIFLLETIMLTDDEVRARYGPDVAISRKGRFVLVHVDAPTQATVETRTEAFDPGVCFEAGCPLCEIQRSQGIYVFESFPDEDEEILLD